MDPSFGFRFFGLGPISQCIDAGIVVFAQDKKLGILGREMIDGVFLVRKYFPDMTCAVIHCLFRHFKVMGEIKLIFGQVFGNNLVSMTVAADYVLIGDLKRYVTVTYM